MTNPVAPNVRVKPVDFAALVRRAEGKELTEKPIAYEFSNGRKFEDSGENGGPYRQN